MKHYLVIEVSLKISAGIGVQKSATRCLSFGQQSGLQD